MTNLAAKIHAATDQPLHSIFGFRNLTTILFVDKAPFDRLIASLPPYYQEYEVPIQRSAPWRTSQKVTLKDPLSDILVLIRTSLMYTFSLTLKINAYRCVSR